MNRNIDGIFFRVNRDGKWNNVCFSDMTTDERSVVMNDRDTVWLKSLCSKLADIVHDIGDQFDIVCQ